MAIERKTIGVGVFLLVTVLMTSLGFYAYQIVTAPNILIGGPDRKIILEEDMTFKQLQNKLYDQNYVNDLVSFSFLARLMDYDKLMKPGLYQLKADMSNLEAIRLLRSGAQVPTSITFTNVRLLSELPEKICNTIGLESDTLKKLMMDERIQQNYGFDSLTFVSMFLPNTYEVYYTISAKELLNRMKREYDAFWSEERMKKAAALNMTPVEVSILASIVEAEQKVYPEEWKTIAGLYINRLRKGYRLDSDPTLVFAHQDFSINRVLNRHKEINSPFNTYKNFGLPPGPILCPQIGAIQAVLDYEKHSYLYMCARADFSGYHEFARNLIEHNRNAAKFQQALNRRRIYN